MWFVFRVMWFVFRAMWFVAISPEHQRPLGVKPPAVAPSAAMAHSWATIVDMAAQAQMQPKERSNEALKHYRDLVETSGTHGVHIPLNTPTVLVRKCTHGRGEEFSFEADPPLVPWSWPQMLVRLGDK